MVFTAGVAAAGAIPDAFGLWLMPAAAFCLAAAAASWKRAWSAWFLYAGTAAVGCAHAWLSQPGRAADELHRHLVRPEQFVEMTFRIDSDPAAIAGADGRAWRVTARPESVKAAGGAWVSAGGRISLRMPAGEGPTPAYGQRWHAAAVVRADAAGRLSADLRPPAVLLSDTSTGGYPLMRWCFAQREASRKALIRGIEAWPDAAGFISALVLGYRADVPPQVRETFMRTGTAHVFAISGLHVGIFATVLAGFLRAAGLPRRWWAAALLPMLALYTLATGAAVSAMRAFVMAAAWWAAPAFRRRPDPPSALGLAAVIILAVAPSQVTEPGFWFSFLVVTALLMSGSRMPLENRTEDDLTPQPDNGGWLADFWRRALTLPRASWAAWLGSTPLTLYVGHQIAPAALAGNLVVIPAAFLIVLTGCLSLICSPVWPSAALTFNHANAAIATAVMAAVERLFRVPGAYWFAQAPPLWAVVAAYAALAGLRILRGRPRRVLAAAATAVAAAGAIRYATDDRVRLVFPPPDLAPAVLLDGPGERNDWLIDPGPEWQAQRTLRWLRSRGVDRLGAVVLTTLDADHAGALPELLRHVPTKRLLYTAAPARSPVGRQALEAWRAAGRSAPEALADGAGGVGPGGLEWAVWHPPPGAAFARAADGALWFRAARGSTAVLFAGAATAAQQAALRRPNRDAIATLVVMDRPPMAGDAGWLAEVRAREVLLRPLRGPGAAVPAALSDGPRCRVATEEWERPLR